MKILFIEDDQRTADFVLKGLKQAGYNVCHADNGEDGLFFAETEKYDLLIVDIMLPKLDGLSLIGRLRKKKNMVPVIILSAKNTVDDRVTGLETGSDDYLVKPFAFTELLARIQTIIRRSTHIPEATTLKVGDMTLDLLKRKFFINGTEIFLPQGEFVLLEYLMRNAGRVVSKTMIIENVWDYSFDPQTNVIEVRIRRLRNKIERPFHKKFIRTVRGYGYVLEETE